MKKLFSTQKVNTGRQIEWDYTKVFAIILLIVTHYLAYCSLGNADFEKTTDTMFILAQISTPVLMFAMGIGMAYTRHDSPRDFIVRGIKLLLLGMIVNTMYFLSNYTGGIPMDYSLSSFLANNILHFAGLTFILVGIFKMYNFRTIKIFIISIGFSLIASYTSDFTFGNIYLNQFLGNFIETVGKNIITCFPVLNWFIIPICGMLFGENLIRCNYKDELYSRIIRPAHTMTFIIMIVGIALFEGMFSVTGGTIIEKLKYLHASLPEMVVLIILTVFIGSIFYFLTKKSSPSVIDFIIKTSHNVTVIYIIQLALILLLTYINQFLNVKPNLGIEIAVLILIIVSSILLGHAYAGVKGHLMKS